MTWLDTRRCSVGLPAGEFALRPVDPDRDVALLHGWMNDPEVARFWELALPPGRIAAYLCDQLGSAHSTPYIGELDGVPMSYWELYRADLDPLADHYSARRADAGVHLLLGPAACRGRGLATPLLRVVAEWQLEAAPPAERVVAEPDVANVRSVRAFAGAGFRRVADIDLPEKRAALMVRDRRPCASATPAPHSNRAEGQGTPAPYAEHADTRTYRANTHDVDAYDGDSRETRPRETPTYDLVGVGIGPFNLSLAALAEALPDVSAVFLDEGPEFRWHPGMLIAGTTLQVPFLADLVTLADPTSPYSFLAYLAAHERLFPFYFAERFHVPRKEYEHYCQWVAASLPSCRFGLRVTRVRWDEHAEVFHVAASGPTGRTELTARNVVLGIGTEPVVPEPLRGLLGKEVFHSASYLDRAGSLRGAGDVTVLGSGQSGAEVFLDLLRAQEDAGWRLRWLTRSPAFAPMEYSKLGLEHFTPDYSRYFHRLPEAERDRLVPEQWQLYKAISDDTIAAIHDVLYERGIGGGRPDVTMMPNVAVTAARAVRGGVELDCRETRQGATFTAVTDRVVAATGYVPRCPDLLDRELVAWDGAGRFRVGADYGVALDPQVTGGLYVQNAETHTHGVGAPDLGLGAHRAATILNAVTGRQAYSLPERAAYTTFGVPRDAPRGSV